MPAHNQSWLRFEHMNVVQSHSSHPLAVAGLLYFTRKMIIKRRRRRRKQKRSEWAESTTHNAHTLQKIEWNIWVLLECRFHSSHIKYPIKQSHSNSISVFGIWIHFSISSTSTLIHTYIFANEYKRYASLSLYFDVFSLLISAFWLDSVFGAQYRSHFL